MPCAEACSPLLCAGVFIFLSCAEPSLCCPLRLLFFPSIYREFFSLLHAEPYPYASVQSSCSLHSALFHTAMFKPCFLLLCTQPSPSLSCAERVLPAVYVDFLLPAVCGPLYPCNVQCPLHSCLLQSVLHLCFLQNPLPCSPVQKTLPYCLVQSPLPPASYTNVSFPAACRRTHASLQRALQCTSPL